VRVWSGRWCGSKCLLEVVRGFLEVCDSEGIPEGECWKILSELVVCGDVGCGESHFAAG